MKLFSNFKIAPKETKVPKPKIKKEERIWLVIVIKHKIHANAEDVELYRDRYFKKPQAFKFKRSVEEGISHNTVRIEEIKIADIDEYIS